ncbi:MAG: PAS domain-containing protein [Desulfomonilaceae bacterium]
MNDHTLPSFDLFGEKDEPLPHSQGAGTQTIDLSDLFARDVYSSGTFDLGAISSSTLGRLLDALPIPALLIDRFYQVGFANESCARVSAGYKQIRGLPFADLVPLPTDVARAQALTAKIQALIHSAFETRKPRVAEAILEIENRKIWARLHLRSVRIGLERYVLLTIEDLTSEKKQLALSQRNDQRYRQESYKLGKCMDELTLEIRKLQEQLSLESAEHLNTQESLSRQKQEFDSLWDGMPLGLALVGNDGSVQRFNPKFNEMFGSDGRELANNSGYSFDRNQIGAKPSFHRLSDWVDAVALAGDKGSTTSTVEVERDNGHSEIVGLTAIRITDEKLLLIVDANGKTPDR